jgi:predicted unusual protein kinase regulating ubiquinone biosynthesis (AarF/ABC1/UbiB family)
MGDVMELAIADARGEDIEQYRVQQIVQQVEDTIYEFPLRLPANLALVLRVATVVEGVCVTLDPDFDFISVATDYLGEQGYIAAGVRSYVEDRATEVSDAAQSAVRIPPKLESVLDRVDREELTVRADIRDSDGLLATLTKRLILGMLLASALFSTAFLFAEAANVVAAVAGVGVVGLAVALWWSFRSKQGVRAKPQFTRQSMREREGENVGGVGVPGESEE